MSAAASTLSSTASPSMHLGRRARADRERGDDPDRPRPPRRRGRAPGRRAATRTIQTTAEHPGRHAEFVVRDDAARRPRPYPAHAHHRASAASTIGDQPEQRRRPAPATSSRPASAPERGDAGPVPGPRRRAPRARAPRRLRRAAAPAPLPPARPRRATSRRPQAQGTPQQRGEHGGEEQGGGGGDDPVEHGSKLGVNVTIWCE